MNPIVCIALCTILTAAFLGFIWAQVLTEDRHRAERREEADAHRQEVAALLQRIQAPEQAVIEHAAAQNVQPQRMYVPWDDDDAFHEAVSPSGHDH